MSQTVETTDVLGHPALAAWRKLGSDRPEPVDIDTLKGKETSHRKKSSVFRLSRVGPGGYVVIAKRCRRSTAMNESVIYREVLPQLPVPTLRFYGMVEDANQSDSWLFIEDAGDSRYSRETEQHRHLAAEWLALLHGCGARLKLADQLPDQGPESWLRQIRASRDTIAQNVAHPVLTEGDRHTLEQLLSRCEAVEARWDPIVRFCAGMPHTIVHGDFVAKNMRVRHHNTRPALMPFDWECVGWGVPAADLTQHSTHSPFPDLDTYRIAARQFWPELRAQHVERLAAIGRIVRLISGIGWACESLGYGHSRDWMAKPLAQLRTYQESLGEAILDFDRSDAAGPLAQYPEDTTLTDVVSSALRGPGVAGGAVEIRSRTRNGSQSSFPSELVTCRLEEGETQALFLKYGTGYVRYSYGHKGGVAYESEVYRRLLQPLGVSVPGLRGVHTDPSSKAVWLVLDHLSGCRAVSEKVPGSMPLAARWIGQFHTAAEARLAAAPVPFLREYDAAYYRGWIERTSRFAGERHREFPWLRGLCGRCEGVTDILVGIPRTVIHGEFYYKNVLIQDGTIRPIDWESAAVAFGEIDLAALIDGGWPADIVAECQRDYTQVRWPDGPPQDFERRLDAARLYLHFRWLGNLPTWTTGKKRRWRFEAMHGAAERLGLL